MGIKIASPETQPAVEYDHVFMETLTIHQKTYTDDAAAPEYSLQVIYRMYGLDEDGKRHYKAKNRSICVDDVMTEATMMAMGGDMSLANAMGAIEIALAKILEKELGASAMVD